MNGPPRETRSPALVAAGRSPGRHPARLRGPLTVALALAWLLSCDKGEIIHEYPCDLGPLAALATRLDVDLRGLPGATAVFARDGMNTSSRQPQPDGIVDWVRLDVLPGTPGRTVTADVRAFAAEDAASRFMGWEVAGWRPSRPDRYRRGVLASGVEYVASYIVQDRADPEGCSGPMESYRAFLMFRAGKHLVVLEVHEDRPRGVLTDETRYVVELLSRPRPAPAEVVEQRRATSAASGPTPRPSRPGSARGPTRR